MYLLAALVVPSLVLALLPGVSSSRRLLAAALVLLVPFAGPLLAIIVRRTRGGKIAPEPMPCAPERRLTAADVNRLGEMPPVLERLMTGDHAERLSALVDLSNAGDASAVGVLRWTIEHGPPEVVLDAALTLEEIGLRGEATVQTSRQALADEVSYEKALAAADAAAACVIDRLADPAIARMLAEEARTGYALALAHAPDKAREIDNRLARLELAASRPRAALDILARLEAAEAADAAQVAALRDHAAFAARDFGRLSFIPCALALVGVPQVSAQAVLKSS